MIVKQLVLFSLLLIIIDGNGTISSLKTILRNDVYRKLFLSLTSSILLDNNNNNNNNIGNNSKNLLIMCPGYKIPIECYNTLYNIIENSIPNCETIIYNSNNIENNDSILTDVTNLKNLLLSKVDKQMKNIIIFSHSRGGSVSLSSLLLAKKLNKDIQKLLILLDPVDDSNNNAMKILKEYPNDKNDIKILLIKLPYAGYSKFYKKSFESSCAPIGRNADTFNNILEENHYDVDYKIIQEFGHFGLLEKNELERLAIGNVCYMYDNNLSLSIIKNKEEYAYNIIEEFIKSNLE